MTIWASLQIFEIPSMTSHFWSKEEVVASKMLRQISLKKISIWDLRWRLYLVNSSMKRAKESSKTSLMDDTPFWKWSINAIFTREADRGARALSIFRATNKSAFSTSAQSRFASIVLDGVLGPLHLASNTWRWPCISVAPKQRTRRGWGSLKGAVSDFLHPFLSKLSLPERVPRIGRTWLLKQRFRCCRKRPRRSAGFPAADEARESWTSTRGTLDPGNLLARASCLVYTMTWKKDELNLILMNVKHAPNTHHFYRFHPILPIIPNFTASPVFFLNPTQFLLLKTKQELSNLIHTVN